MRHIYRFIFGRKMQTDSPAINAPAAFSPEPHHIRGVQAAIDFAEASIPGGIIKAEEMAWQACMSPFHFDRVFKTVTGLPPAAYVRERRISVAASQLLQSEDSALKIGMNFGYGSPEAFSRAFKQHFYLSPGEFRRFGAPPYLLAQKIQISRRPSPFPDVRIRAQKIPSRLYLGLFRSGENEHSSNILVDYELLKYESGNNNRNSIIFLDRTPSAAASYEMFIGWDMNTLSRIPEGMEPLEIPEHYSIVATYRGYIDNQAEADTRRRITAGIVSEYGIPMPRDMWKITHSAPDPEQPGFRRWELEIPLSPSVQTEALSKLTA